MEGQIEMFGNYKIDLPIRLIELFGGIGSQSMSLRDIGANYESYRYIEIDKYAVNIYNSIFGTYYKPSDITKINGRDLGINDIDKYCYIMTYSFPCQDLSRAGKQRGMVKGSGTRSGLLWEVERLLNETENLPQILLMENVTQVHSKKNMPEFQKWLDYLSSRGYFSKWHDMNAKDYGIPQNRDRCFCVSILGNYTYDFPKPIKLEHKAQDFLDMDNKETNASEEILSILGVLDE